MTEPRRRSFSTRSFRCRHPISRFSAMVRCVNTRRPCGTNAMPSFTISCVATASGSCLHRTCPATTGARPMIALSTVDFPAPLGPMTATTSPSRTPSDTASRAFTTPYRTDTSVSSSMLSSGTAGRSAPSCCVAIPVSCLSDWWPTDGCHKRRIAETLTPPNTPRSPLRSRAPRPPPLRPATGRCPARSGGPTCPERCPCCAIRR